MLDGEELYKSKSGGYEKGMGKQAEFIQKYFGATEEEIKNNTIYKNAFEWRFEFPEVINNKGDFEGFDLIIGNPPY